MSRTPQLNPRLRATASPPIPSAQRWLADYGGDYGDPVDLSQAVPGYPPHPELLAKLSAAGGDPEHARYGDIAGDALLREVYAGSLGRTYAAHVRADEVLITAGCNQAFFVAMMTIASAGEAVLLPEPWYFNHEMTLRMLGIEARPFACGEGDGFVPQVDEALARMDAKVRAIALVTPNNPTGAVYPPQTIAAFAELCQRHRIWLVVDETYRDFLPHDQGQCDQGQCAPHAVLADPELRERFVQLFSFSKSYCIPGHRVGALVAPGAFVEQSLKVMDSLQICAPRAPQAALGWAIPALGSWVEGNRKIMANRMRAFEELVAGLPHWEIMAMGAYFAYVRHPLANRSGLHVASALARERGVVALPGSFFGPTQDPYLRVAFANAPAQRISALEARLRNFH